jgi:hypothetical protein
MRTLQEATEMICDLKGSVIALDALIGALMHHVPEAQRAALGRTFEANAEVARTVLLNATISEHTLKGFEADVGRYAALIRSA